MVVNTDVRGAMALIQKVMHEVEHADDTVASVVREDAEKTEMDFHSAGNTTSRADEKVTVEKRGNMIIERASGTEVMFKEFGTGMNYADHPLGAKRGAVRGGYGLGRAKDPGGWTFSDSPGMEGQYSIEVGGTDEVSFYITQGQPPSMSMYNSFRRIFDYIPKAIKERLL